MRRFAGNTSFCQAHACEVLAPTSTYLSPIYNCVCFICRNFIPSKILSLNIISRNSIYNANGIFEYHGSFVVYALLPGTSKAFTLSLLFLLGAHVHVLLPGTRREDDLTFKCYVIGQFHGNGITNQRFLGSYLITLCSTPMILVSS